MSMVDVLRDCGLLGPLDTTPILRELVREVQRDEARDGVPTDREPARPRPFGRRRY